MAGFAAIPAIASNLENQLGLPMGVPVALCNAVCNSEIVETVGKEEAR